MDLSSKKKKSRAVVTEAGLVTTKPVRKKVNAEVRNKRITELEEEIENFDQQVQFKEMRRKEAESAKKI